MWDLSCKVAFLEREEGKSGGIYRSYYPRDHVHLSKPNVLRSVRVCCGFTSSFVCIDVPGQPMYHHKRIKIAEKIAMPTYTNHRSARSRRSMRRMSVRENPMLLAMSSSFR